MNYFLFQILRPHPERLEVGDEGDELGPEEENSDEDASKETKSKKYVPPKLMAVHYNGNNFLIFSLRHCLFNLILSSLWIYCC